MVGGFQHWEGTTPGRSAAAQPLRRSGCHAVQFPQVQEPAVAQDTAHTSTLTHSRPSNSILSSPRARTATNGAWQAAEHGPGHAAAPTSERVSAHQSAHAPNRPAKLRHPPRELDPGRDALACSRTLLGARQPCTRQACATRARTQGRMHVCTRQPPSQHHANQTRCRARHPARHACAVITPAAAECPLPAMQPRRAALWRCAWGALSAPRPAAAA